MVKTLTYDNPDHKIKPKTRQFQVMGKSTGQINNTGYEHRFLVTLAAATTLSQAFGVFGVKSGH